MMVEWERDKKEMGVVWMSIEISVSYWMIMPEGSQSCFYASQIERCTGAVSYDQRSNSHHDNLFKRASLTMKKDHWFNIHVKENHMDK